MEAFMSGHFIGAWEREAINIDICIYISQHLFHKSIGKEYNIGNRPQWVKQKLRRGDLLLRIQPGKPSGHHVALTYNTVFYDIVTVSTSSFIWWPHASE